MPFSPNPLPFARIYPIGLIALCSVFLFGYADVASGSSGDEGEVRVAVASNFLAPLKQLAVDFKQQTGHRLRISAGSTGKLYAQIVNGAPFDLFLAANQREPKRLDDAGQTISGSRFTYAEGRLALWNGGATEYGWADPGVLSGTEMLCQAKIQRLALANPKTAPYGAAALEVIKRLDCFGALRRKLIRGENVAQAYQFVATGNAQFGFVSLSQLADRAESEYRVIDARAHQPIAQQVVLLKRAAGNAAATEFLRFLKSPDAEATIRGFGYDLPVSASAPAKIAAGQKR